MKDNVYVKWAHQLRVTEAQDVPVLTPVENLLSIGNFHDIVVYIEVIADGSANVTLKLEHGMEEDGAFTLIDAAGTVLNGRSQALVTFDKDVNSDFLGRYLRWAVESTVGALDVTFSLSVLLRR